MHIQVLRSFAQLAERRISTLNAIVQEAAEVGLVPRTALLGQIVQQRPYEPAPGGSSSGQVVQAGLLIPGGIGVLLWDTEDFLALQRQDEGLESAAWNAFVPFDQCSAAFRAYLGAQYGDLLLRFVGLFD
jgi:hypothetical protein